ncbi:MAG: GtrA family protein [Clostridia bacterium]|nr:GtrA family protein [Clostridia bacterium]
MKKLYNKAMELYRKYKEIFWYLVVGGLTTVVSYGTYALFYSLFSLNATLSETLSWVCAVLFAYPTNKLLVFENHSKNILLEFSSFVASRVATGAFGVAFMWLFVDMLLCNGYLMKAISSIVILVLNYVFSKLITFRKKKEKTPDPVTENTQICVEDTEEGTK